MKLITAGVLLIVVIAGFLLSCSTKTPDPVVVDESCYLEELRPKPELPTAEPAKVDCPYHRCYDEQNFNKIIERILILEEDSNYVRGTYNDARGRCNSDQGRE